MRPILFAVLILAPCLCSGSAFAWQSLPADSGTPGRSQTQDPAPGSSMAAGVFLAFLALGIGYAGETVVY